MHIPHAIAAALMGLTTMAHIFGGGPEYHHVFQNVLPTTHLASLAAVLWHTVTINLLVFAGAYAWLSFHRSDALALVIGAMQFGWALLFLFYGITMLGSVWVMPQWVVFAGVPLLSLYAVRQPSPA